MLNIEDDAVWRKARQFCGAAFRSSLHFAIASVNAEGKPHVSPIGSLCLQPDRRGFFFEIFTRALPMHLESNTAVSILAVDSSRLFWLRSLWKGRFDSWPALQFDAEAFRRALRLAHLSLHRRRPRNRPTWTASRPPAPYSKACDSSRRCSCWSAPGVRCLTRIRAALSGCSS